MTKEFRDIEINLLVSRTVVNTSPVTGAYAITDNGRKVSTGCRHTLRNEVWTTGKK